MKKKYRKAEVEIIELDDEDTVVTASWCKVVFQYWKDSARSEVTLDSNNSFEASGGIITNNPDPIDEMLGIDDAAQVDNLIEDATGGATTVFDEVIPNLVDEAADQGVSVASEVAAESSSVASTID